MGCEPCCCSDCPENPRSLRVSVVWPEGGGEMIPDAPTPEPPPGLPPGEPEYLAVSTNCLAAPPDRYVASIRMLSRGDGYTSVPDVTISGGSPDRAAVLSATVSSPVRSATITNGGSGYTSNPTMTFSGFSSRPAAATAIVRGAVTSVTITDGGAEYTSPPTFTFAGGGTGAEITPTLGDGYVLRIEIVEGGQGYTSSPSVSVEGTSLAANAFVSNGSVSVINIQVPDYNAGYAFGAEPAVTISGGGGSGASARAVIGYSILSATVEEGGTGYLANPVVTVSGGEGRDATATAVVTGSVQEIRFTDAGRYSITKVFDGEDTAGQWPTATLTGGGGSGAQVSLSFSGGVSVGIPVISGDGYSSVPTISISGGGGSGASAVAELSWEATHTRTYGLLGCAASDTIVICTETESEEYPDVPCDGCGGQAVPTDNPSSENLYGESLGWQFQASTSLPTTFRGLSSRFFGPSGDARDYDFIFPGEGVTAYWRTFWDADFGEVLDENGDFLFDYAAEESLERAYVQKAFSRVPPPASLKFFALRTSAGVAISGGTAIEFTPTFVQYADLLGQPLWRLESISGPASGGQNLRLRSSDTLYIAPDRQADAVAATGPTSEVECEFTATYATPVASSFSSATFISFNPKPAFECSFSPTATPGEYEVSSVTILSGGVSLGGQNYTDFFTISSLSTGHKVADASLRATISAGVVTQVEVIDGGLYLGGGTITSATLIEEEDEEVFNDMNRIFTGMSGQQTDSEYSEPTVTAAPESGSTPAELSVTIEEQTDENGNPYWRVTEVAIDSGGAGHPADVPIVFSVAGEYGTADQEAIAVGVLGPGEEPTLEATAGGNGDAVFSITYAESNGEWGVSAITVSDGGTGYEDGAAVAFTLGAGDFEVSTASAFITTTKTQPQITASVDGGSGAALTVNLQEFFGTWEVASVSVDTGGSGYQDGDVVQFQGGDQGDGGAYAVITTDGSGSILSVSVFFGGSFFDSTGVIDSVTVTSAGAYYKQSGELQSITLTSGGRYYNLEITENENPLPELVCVGTIGEPRWRELNYRREEVPGFERPEITPGTSFDGVSQAGCWNANAPSFFYNWTRTRQCPLPQIELEIVQ